MAVYMSGARMVNLQSHVDTIFDFPENGVVRFLGGNSNGKSVFVKALSKVLKNRLHILRERVPLVRRTEEKGFLILTRSDGMILEVCIAKESSQTYLELKIPAEGVVLRRHITTDKNVMELVRMFGFHIEEKRNISLNLYETFGELIMVTTTGVENSDLVTSVITDYRAEKAKESITGLRKEFKSAHQILEKDIVTQQALLGILEFYPEEEFNRKALELNYLAHNLTHLTTPTIKFLKYVPNMEDILNLEIESIGRVLALREIKSLPSLFNIEKLTGHLNVSAMHEQMSDIAAWVESFRIGECMACGRTFVEGGCCN